VDGLVRILGCRVSSLPLRYLGLHLSAPFKAIFIWDTILEKMEKRLAYWKRLYLSKGGRMTLIKSTLSIHISFLFSLC
jgi:hypothetical protein